MKFSRLHQELSQPMASEVRQFLLCYEKLTSLLLKWFHFINWNARVLSYLVKWSLVFFVTQRCGELLPKIPVRITSPKYASSRQPSANGASRTPRWCWLISANLIVSRVFRSKMFVLKQHCEINVEAGYCKVKVIWQLWPRIVCKFHETPLSDAFRFVAYV